MDNIENVVSKYIFKEIMFNTDEFTINSDESLFENGILDSLGLQTLVPYLENQFNISIPLEEIVPENFETIKAISNLVRKLA